MFWTTLISALWLLGPPIQINASIEQCNQLKNLHQQYSGVSRRTFSPEMRQFERQARSWYRKNCRS